MKKKKLKKKSSSTAVFAPTKLKNPETITSCELIKTMEKIGSLGSLENLAAVECAARLGASLICLRQIEQCGFVCDLIPEDIKSATRILTSTIN